MSEGVKDHTFKRNVIGSDQLNETVDSTGTWLSARFTRPVAIEVEVRYWLVVEESFSNCCDAFVTESVLRQIQVIDVSDLRTNWTNHLCTRKTPNSQVLILRPTVEQIWTYKLFSEAYTARLVSGLTLLKIDLRTSTGTLVRLIFKYSKKFVLDARNLVNVVHMSGLTNLLALKLSRRKLMQKSNGILLSVSCVSASSRIWSSFVSVSNLWLLWVKGLPTVWAWDLLSNRGL